MLVQVLTFSSVGASVDILGGVPAIHWIDCAAASSLKMHHLAFEYSTFSFKALQSCNLQPDCIHSIDCAELPDCRVLQYFLTHCTRLLEIHFTCTDRVALVASQCILLPHYNSSKELLIGNWQVSKHTADPSKTLVTMICSSKHQARPLFC